MLKSYSSHLGGLANKDGSHYDSIWEELFAALKLYKQNHGDCLVPQRYSEDPRLGRWVNTQRSLYKAGELSDDREERLVNIGFNFDPYDTRWEELFAALKLYKQNHGDCLVPQRYSEDPRLGRWVNTQRSLYKAGELSDDREERLVNIGFNFDPYGSIWNENFAALKLYKQNHGNCLVPRRYSEDPRLGRWVKTQRALYKAGELSDDREERLVNIGFSFGGEP
ncbi:hypothetical protein ACHAXR_012737 [Thalassiosira sp. AJA248-18]